MKSKHIAPLIAALIICLISLAVGASFHGLRMHPENAEAYSRGCTMGIIMASVAAVAFVTFIVLFVRYKKSGK
jgi:hypothetical protein